MAVNGRNIALTGVPRGGTTLACRLLGGCGDTVALFEPMDVARLPRDPDAAMAEVTGFFRDVRSSLLRDGRAPTKQRHGTVPDNPFADDRDATGERRLLVSPGWLKVDPPPEPGFTLVVKHNAAFAALLPRLDAAMDVVAIVRHPLAVIASWNSVALPVREGRQPAGERLDPGLEARLAAEPAILQRQLILLDWYFSRFARLPARRVVRYEDVIASQGQALFDCAGLAGKAPGALQDRNANAAWRGVDLEPLVAALQADAGAWRDWYPVEGIDALADRLRTSFDVGRA